MLVHCPLSLKSVKSCKVQSAALGRGMSTDMQPPLSSDVLVQRVQRKRVFAYDESGTSTKVESPPEQDALKQYITTHFIANEQDPDENVSHIIQQRRDYLMNVEKSLIELNQILALSVQLKTKEYATLTTCTRPATTLHAPLQPLSQRIQHVRNCCAAASDILQRALTASSNVIAQRRAFTTHCLSLRKHWKLTSAARKTTLSLRDGLAIDCSSTSMPIADVVRLRIGECGAVVSHKSGNLHTLVAALFDSAKGCLGSVRLCDVHFVSAEDTVEGYCRSLQHDAVARRCFYLLQQQAQNQHAIVAPSSSSNTHDITSLSLTEEVAILRLNRGQICISVAPSLNLEFSLQLQTTLPSTDEHMELEHSIDYNKILSLLLLHTELEVIRRSRKSESLSDARSSLIHSVTRFLKYHLLLQTFLSKVNNVVALGKKYGLQCSVVVNASREALSNEFLAVIYIDNSTYNIVFRDVITVTTTNSPVFNASSIYEFSSYMDQQVALSLLKRLVPSSAALISACNMFALYSSNVPFARLGSVSAAIDEDAVVVTIVTSDSNLLQFILKQKTNKSFCKTNENAISCRTRDEKDCEIVKKVLELISEK